MLIEISIHRSGFQISAYSLWRESGFNSDPKSDKLRYSVPPGALPNFFMKALHYIWMEVHTTSTGKIIECTSPFHLLKHHACEFKNETEAEDSPVDPDELDVSSTLMAAAAAAAAKSTSAGPDRPATARSRGGRSRGEPRRGRRGGRGGRARLSNAARSSVEEYDDMDALVEETQKKPSLNCETYETQGTVSPGGRQTPQRRASAALTRSATAAAAAAANVGTPASSTVSPPPVGRRKHLTDTLSTPLDISNGDSSKDSDTEMNGDTTEHRGILTPIAMHDDDDQALNALSRSTSVEKHLDTGEPVVDKMDVETPPVYSGTRGILEHDDDHRVCNNTTSGEKELDDDVDKKRDSSD
eukprot:GHVL01009170.1.p1 GENE.GHVL01009170.1~~GHVL01009170.1.p1  ORF type:complete len:356 (+),score=63.08 GHVL01009170.1:170-1237(+)